jgi:hypothetical protein
MYSPKKTYITCIQIPKKQVKLLQNQRIIYNDFIKFEFPTVSTVIVVILGEQNRVLEQRHYQTLRRNRQ